ncbi:chaplin [Streptomyces sp. A108]|nr:chaplin [Streptomyces sp. A108]
MVAAAAATGILSLCGSPALADSQADGAATNSPGAVSGNALQVPVHVPVNACGNSIDVVGVLNPAFGNECENSSDQETGGHGGGYGEDAQSSSGSSSSGGGAHAEGGTEGSPGVGSGNNAQVPVDVPVNLCGNTIDVIAALNPVFGNKCENTAEEPPGYGEEEPPGYGEEEPPGYGEEEPPGEEEQPPPAEEEQPPPPAAEEPPPPAEEEHTPPAPQTEQPPVLAETGSAGALGAGAAGAVLIAGGAILYRRGRAAAGL